jgi:nickel-dependent lactate racemase
LDKLDFLVALGTHQPMSEDALNSLVGVTGEERRGRFGDVGIFNHRWDQADDLALVGTIPATETKVLSSGLMEEEVPVRVNRRIFDYDHVILCGPVFPHEVVGFSGGAKYLFPGISGEEVIDTTHWLGALLTNVEINGVVETPVRAMIERAASMINVPMIACCMVMRGSDLVGLYAGDLIEAHRAAATLSSQVNIVYLDRQYRQVLAVAPPLYDDLWTAGKAMYKSEPIVADGGELIIYAPHITEVSYTHGPLIDEVGYHCRDYFVKQAGRFTEASRCVLAHSTHVRGMGTYDDGVEKPRVQVTLATGIPAERCARINLGYLDPATIDLNAWRDREDEGILFVPKAGEMLYRLRG